MANVYRYLKWPAALLLAIFVLQACSKTPEATIESLNGMTMGTTYSVKWVANAQTPDAEALQQKISQALLAVNQSMSTYIKDSELSLFNQAPAGTQRELSPALFHVLSLAQSISEKTTGAFDVTVGPLVNLWGFGPEGRIVKAPDPQALEQLRTRVGYHYLTLESETRKATKSAGLYVDLSAIAKGYGVDVLADVMEQAGAESYLVEIGGELRSKGIKPGDNPWRIAIESPVEGERTVQRIVTISDVSIATSGDYRNYFEEQGVRYSHTIDPATGKPITHKLASVTVLMPTCAEADALATAFMVMGEQAAYEFALEHKIEAFFIVKSSEGFNELMTPGFEQRLVK